MLTLQVSVALHRFDTKIFSLIALLLDKDVELNAKHKRLWMHNTLRKKMLKVINGLYNEYDFYPICAQS